MTLFERNAIRLAIMAAAIHIPAWADRSGTATLQPDTYLNLDTGTVSQSGGDVFFDGTKLSPQGSAGLYNLGKVGARTFRSIRAQQATSVSYTAASIPGGALVSGDVFGIHTNSGYYVKAIVSATNYGTLTLQYTIFGLAPVAHAAADPPQILAVENNYSWILPNAGLPNYGIAPGSILVIFGNGLGPSTTPVLQSSASPGLQTTLNQTSISVTVKGVTTTPAIYYTSATQVAAVLPSTTPVGTGTITVTFNGQPSAPAPITVVANAPGLDTLAGTGNGLAVVTDNSGNVYGVASSAKPGATVILWGSGIGADAANDDRLYPQKQDNLAAALGVKVFIGGVSATIQYAGRSQYPGVDQYNVIIPSNVTTGCFVSVVVQIGSIVSNALTMPISANGGACSDSMTGLNGTQIQTLATKSSHAVNGFVGFLYGTPPISGNATPGGSFPFGYVSSFAVAEALSASEFGNGYEYASYGSCTIVPPGQPPFQDSFVKNLDAGTIQLITPGGQPVSFGNGPGVYPATNNFSVSPGLTYTLSGSGGADIGKFSVNVAVPSTQLNWTNANLASITRSQGATITWTGGYPNGMVQVMGSVGDPSVAFYCYAPSSAGQLTIPASILLALPAGFGDLMVTTVTAPQPVTATGLDLGFVATGESLEVYSFFPYN